MLIRIGAIIVGVLVLFGIIRICSFVIPKLFHAVAVKSDTEPPEISCQTSFQIQQFETFNADLLLEKVAITDNVTKYFDNSSIDIAGSVDTEEAGSYTLTLTVADEAGNIGEEDIKVVVVSQYTDEEIEMLQNGIKAYNKLKNSLKNPDSLKILDMRYDAGTEIYSIKYTGTNSYGGTVTEYAIYYNGSLLEDEDAEMYSLMRNDTEITFDDLYSFSNSDYNK